MMTVDSVVLRRLTMLFCVAFFSLVYLQLSTRPLSASYVIGGIRIVNMPERVHKRVEMQAKLSRSAVAVRTGFSFEAAMPGSRQDLHQMVLDGELTMESYNDIVRNEIMRDRLTTGSLGCFLSHRNMWAIVANQTRPYLIMEDEIELSPTFDSKFEKIVDSLPVDFGLLYLAETNDEQRSAWAARREYNNVTWKIEGDYRGAYAYVITPWMASLLLQHMYPVYTLVDSFMQDIAVKFDVPRFLTRDLLVTIDAAREHDNEVQRMMPQKLLIPKILHRVWASTEPMPQEFVEFGETWSRLHPDWQVRLWTSVNMPPLVNQALYDSSTDMGERSGIARIELVYRFGGVFVDNGTDYSFVCYLVILTRFVHVDVQALQSIAPLITDVDGFCAYETRQQVSTAVFGAVAGHPFLRVLVDDLADTLHGLPVSDRAGQHYWMCKAQLYPYLLSNWHMFSCHIFRAVPDRESLSERDRRVAFAVHYMQDSNERRRADWVSSCVPSVAHQKIIIA